MATAAEKRLKVREKYKTIIGRNKYSQNLRNYCYKKYADGCYYSDCSSSVSYTYKAVGLGFGIMNTMGMWDSDKFTDVPVVIKDGIIQNPGVLRIGDMLLFAGTNAARKNWGYVGHVEMVGEISGTTVQLYGHGSGLAKRHEMNAYCRGRYNTKTKNTPIGNTGLLRVRRFIQDDDAGESTALYKGVKGDAVKALQENLLHLGYKLPRYGADGDFGTETQDAVMAFQVDFGIVASGIYDSDTDAALQAALGGHKPTRRVLVTGKSVYVREAPNTAGKILGIAHAGDLLPYGGERSVEGWYLVEYKGKNAWISPKYSEIEVQV